MNHEIQELSRKIVIVGHGLTLVPSLLILIEHKQDIIVLDSKLPHSASKISVGLINPFIGPKLNIPEDFNLCMQENDKFFQNRKAQSYTNYLQSIILHRVFQSEDQKQKWEHLHKDYKRRFLNKNQCKKLGIESILGAGQTSAWKLDTLGFIQYSQTLLIQQKQILD